MAAPTKFAKPIKIEIQHCANFNKPNQLRFVCSSLAQKSIPYIFKFMEGGLFTSGSKYGTLSTTHFCGIAIVKEVISGEPSCRYCAQVYFTVKSLQDYWYYCHFVVTKDLEMCHTVSANSKLVFIIIYIFFAIKLCFVYFRK